MTIDIIFLVCLFSLRISDRVTEVLGEVSPSSIYDKVSNSQLLNCFLYPPLPFIPLPVDGHLKQNGCVYQKTWS